MTEQEALALVLPANVWHKAEGHRRAKLVVVDEVQHSGRYARFRHNWLAISHWCDVRELQRKAEDFE